MLGNYTQRCVPTHGIKKRGLKYKTLFPVPAFILPYPFAAQWRAVCPSRFFLSTFEADFCKNLRIPSTSPLLARSCGLPIAICTIQVVRENGGCKQRVRREKYTGVFYRSARDREGLTIGRKRHSTSITHPKATPASSLSKMRCGANRSRDVENLIRQTGFDLYETVKTCKRTK